MKLKDARRVCYNEQAEPGQAVSETRPWGATQIQESKQLVVR